MSIQFSHKLKGKDEFISDYEACMRRAKDKLLKFWKLRAIRKTSYQEQKTSQERDYFDDYLLMWSAC